MALLPLMTQRCLRSLLPHTSPLPCPVPRGAPHPARGDPYLPVQTPAARLMCCGFLKVLSLVQCTVSQPLPTSGHRAAGSHGLSSPPCFGPRASLCQWVSQLPSPPSIYPVPPALANSPGAHLCVQTPQGLGTSLNILHVSTKRFPFAPMGKGEGGGSLFFGL